MLCSPGRKNWTWRKYRRRAIGCCVWKVNQQSEGCPLGREGRAPRIHSRQYKMLQSRTGKSVSLCLNTTALLQWWYSVSAHKKYVCARAGWGWGRGVRGRGRVAKLFLIELLQIYEFQSLGNKCLTDTKFINVKFLCLIQTVTTQRHLIHTHGFFCGIIKL